MQAQSPEGPLNLQWAPDVGKVWVQVFKRTRVSDRGERHEDVVDRKLDA